MRRHAGFTLLETLVLLSLLGILLTLVASAILSANRATTRAERFSARLDEVRATQTFLHRTVSQALPRTAQVDDHREAVSFVGERQFMSFIGPLPSSLGGGLVLQRIGLRENRLEARFTHAQQSEFAAYGDAQPLLSYVREVNLSYRGVSPERQRTDWLSSWPWPSRLPEAVRIDMTLDGAVPWVTEQISLRLDLSANRGSR